MKLDDVFDDAKAAYAELVAKADGSSAAATEEAPAEDVKSVGDEAVKPAAGGSKEPLPRVNGRFAPRNAAQAKPPSEAEAPQESEEASGEEGVPGDPEATQDAKTAAVSPPPSWTVKSKAAWDALPDHVKADIAKREAEVSQGFAALKEYKDLKPFAEMAAKHNTTIAAALKHYTGIENLLRQDLGQGLSVILQNYGMNQQQAGQFFATLAQKHGFQVAAPAARGGSQAGPQPGDPLYDILKPFIEPLKQEITTLRQTHTSREEADRNAEAQSLAKALDEFASDPANRYYPELEEAIARLFETGYVRRTGNHKADLKTAYDMAAQLHPEVSEALIEQRLAEKKEAERKREQAAADKAKAASRSITGSRVPGAVSKQTEARAPGHDDVEADVRNAYRLLAQR